MAALVVTHGGTSSIFATERDGPQRAADVGLHAMQEGATPLDAAVAACVILEDDPRFNAGTGSNLRLDGKTIELDAAVMWSERRRYGAVAGLRAVKNPVLVARAISDTPHVMLVGSGAERFARALGMPPHDPWTEKAQAKWNKLRDQLRALRLDPADCAWALPDLERYWNYERPLKEIIGSGDTVGAVATDGRSYAAALSTGGTMGTLLGRVGDVPLPGCGLQVGPLGAVACTGNGDELARWQIASRVYRLLEAGMTPEQAARSAVGMFTLDVDVGIIVARGEEHGAASNADMAWAYARGPLP